MSPLLTIYSLVTVLWISILNSTPTLGQQFPLSPLSFAYPGMSASCISALNTTVSCSALLPAVAQRLPRLKQDDLSTICVASCLTSLQTVKQNILQSCTSNDIIPMDDRLYPATYLADYFTYAYRLMCRVDPVTSKYCDVQIMEWMNEGPLTPARHCSDCYLGAAKLQLDSPFGYSDGFASQHNSQTSSCSKTGYAFTKPAPYTISQAGTTTVSSGVSTPTMDSSCITLYTIQSGDTCTKIAEARNVSSYAVYGPNGVSDCSALPTGKKLCLLGECVRYQVKAGDTCDSIIKARVASTGQIPTDAEVFVGWNPSINAACTNLASFVGDYICLSRPMGLLNPKITNDFIPNTVSAWPTGTPVAEPLLPKASGTIEGCLEYRNAKKYVPLQDSYYSSQYQFDTSLYNDCAYVVDSHDISMTDFLRWNPTLKDNQTRCTLAQDLSYCVNHAVKTGDPPVQATLCRNVSMAVVPPSTSKSCTCFTEFGGYDKGIVDCSLLISMYNITNSQLTTWNPWLASNCDVNLYSGLEQWSLRGVCISASGPDSSTTSVQTSSTSSRSASSTTVISSTAVMSSTGTTTRPSTTSNVPSTTVSTTTSASSPVYSPPGSVCIGGTGEGNHMGLCDFNCHLAYCPPPVCTCLSYRDPVPRPSATWPAGYPAPGLDDSYLGLCSFACNHGYCPPGACTTTPR